MEQGRETDVEVAIVGSGFSGVGMGVYLKQAGIDSFLVLEKAGALGGTWRENTYPGAACDVPSHMYSYSFELNPNWTRAFSPQPEILEYLRHCARKYGVLPHIRFNAEVAEARFDEVQGRWVVQLKDGGIVRARSLVLGNGALHLPSLPNIEGRAGFEGTAFHSAQWRHDIELTGREVAVIGTGASAIQFIPEIASKVRRLYVFQRTPPWILPRADRDFDEAEMRRFERFPLWQRLYRAAVYGRLEWLAGLFLTNSRLLAFGERTAKRHLAASISNPKLREALTPKYRMGCKRVLLSNEYYPAMARPNVELVTEPIERITPHAIRTCEGIERAVDAIIYGTGFEVTRYLSPIRIVGLGGQELNALWSDLPRTYLGITVRGFPNLFLLMGPNTGLGHNSMIFMIEAQARYALQCIQALRQEGRRWLNVRAPVQAEFNDALQRRLEGTVWQAGGCRSWYQTSEGRNPTIWPGFTFEYWLRTRRVNLGDYEFG